MVGSGRSPTLRHALESRSTVNALAGESFERVCAGLYMRAAFRNDGNARCGEVYENDGDESDSVCVCLLPVIIIILRQFL